MKDTHILYIDDELHNLNAFKATFRNDFTVHTSLSVKDAWPILEKFPIQVAILDYKMPIENGLDMLIQLYQRYPMVMRIMITGYADIQVLKRAINEGRIFKYLEKPWDLETLKSAIREGAKEFSIYSNLTEKIQLIIKEKTKLEIFIKDKINSST
jgi:DNA-binding NtrC family response regulator